MHSVVMGRMEDKRISSVGIDVDEVSCIHPADVTIISFLLKSRGGHASDIEQ